MLTDNYISLRAPEPSDIDTLYIWENDTEAWRVSFTYAPVSRSQLWKYLESYSGVISDTGQLRFIIEEASTGEKIGVVDLSDYDTRHRRAQVGIYISRDRRGKSFAKSAIALISDYAKDFLGIHDLYAMVPSGNEGSMALFKSSGFKTSGCLRSWLRQGSRYSDVIIFQKFL